MTKRIRRKKRAQKRETNWWIIGGMILGGIVLVALVALSFRGQKRLDLEVYCDNNPENCIVEGAADAPVTVVEVSDYGCVHCRNFNSSTAPTIQDEFVETGRVKWVVMPFALSDLTIASSVAAMCAAEQDKFTDFHLALFALQDDQSLFNTEEGFMRVAQEVGLDEAAFESCLADNEYEGIVRRNMTAASNAGVDSTPSFMLDGELLRGNQPFSVFQQRIASLQ